MSAKTRKQDRRTSEPLMDLPVDMSPLLEMYVAIFCKHLYYNPAVDRDIQIIILPHQAGPQDPKESATFSNVAVPPSFGQLSYAGMLQQLLESDDRIKDKSELLFKFRNTN